MALRARKVQIERFRPPKTAAGGTGAGGTGAGGGDGRFGGLKPGQKVVCQINNQFPGGYLVTAITERKEEVRGYLRTEFLHTLDEEILAIVTALDTNRVLLSEPEDESKTREYPYERDEKLVCEILLQEPRGYLVVIAGNRLGYMLSLNKRERGDRVEATFLSMLAGRPLLNDSFQDEVLVPERKFEFNFLHTVQLSDGLIALRNAHYIEAIHHFKEIVECNPENYLALYFLAEALMQFYGVVVAFKFYAACLERQPEGPFATEIKAIFESYASFLRKQLLQVVFFKQTVDLKEALAKLDTVPELNKDLQAARVSAPKDKLRKGYGLVGIVLQNSTISEIFAGTPAEQAGLQVGDRIVMINGFCCGMSNYQRIKKLLIGPIGTKVEIVVARDGKRVPFSLERGKPLEYAREYFDFDDLVD